MSSVEEESFIILEETPSLLEPYSLLQIPVNRTSEPTNETDYTSIHTIDLMDDIDDGNSSKTNNIHQKSILGESNGTRSASMTSSQTKDAIPTNLAESFLLGAIDRNEMMNSISSHFPSLINSATKTEDIERLQKLVHEHSELKENLQQSNVTMRQQFSLVNSWLENTKGVKEKQQNEIDELKRVNTQLIDENSELKRRLNEFESMNAAANKSNEETDKKMDELTVLLSKLNGFDSVTATESRDTTKLDATMQAVAQLVETQKRREDEEVAFVSIKSTTAEDNDAKKRYDELDARMKHVQFELSNAIAEKVELEEMKQTYVDELNCVHVQLVASEELYRATKAETKEQQATIATLNQDKKTLQNALAVLQEQMSVVQLQADVYKTDFEKERGDRQEIAGQKEQLAADLQLLQNRNEELQKALENATSARSPAAATAPASPAPANVPNRQQPMSLSSESEEEHVAMYNEYICPVCSIRFSNVDNLYRHVNECLEKLH